MLAAGLTVGVLLIGCPLVASGCGGDSDATTETSGDPFADLPVVTGKALTRLQEQEVVKLLRTDEQAQAFIGDRSYEITQLGPWLERDDRNRRRLVGSTLILAFSQPVDYEMREWPAVSYGSGGEGADTTGIHYETETASFAAANVPRLMIDVDLSIDQVVGIQPDGERVEYTLSDELKNQVPTEGTGE